MRLGLLDWNLYPLWPQPPRGLRGSTPFQWGRVFTSHLNPHHPHSTPVHSEALQGWIIAPRGTDAYTVQFSSVLSCVQLFVTPWTAAHQASLSFTISRSLLKLMSIESMMPSNHLILCRPLLLLPSIFPSIRVFANESVLRIRWPKD